MTQSRTRSRARGDMSSRLSPVGLIVLLGLVAACTTATDDPTPMTDAVPPPAARSESSAPEPSATAPPSQPATATTASGVAVTTPSAAPTSPSTVPTAEPTAATRQSAATVPTTTPILASPTPAPVPPTPTSLAPASSTTQLWLHEAKDFAAGKLNGAVVDGNTLRLAGNSGAYAREGELLSPEHETAFPFDDVVLSWNAESPRNTELRFDVRVRQATGWSGWYTLGTWKDGAGASVPSQSDDRARVEIDTLKLRAPADALQYRVALTTSDSAVTPNVRLVAAVYADLSKPLTGPDLARPDGGARELDVPAFSQLDQDPSVAGLVCSPTSLSMVLAYWQQGLPVPEVIRGVQDRASGIYGNWPLNTAFASTQGLESLVDRFYAMEQLEAEIAAGRPVVTSIRFDRGQLDNAPLLSTDGHLVVVRGFTDNGDVIVNDPYGQGAGIRRVYRRDQFARIWIGNGGIVYLVRPADAT